MKVYPPGAVTRYGAQQLNQGVEATIIYTSHDGGIEWHLHGGLSPIAGVQEGAFLVDGVSGLMPTFTHAELKGARQDGTTWQHTVYEPAEMDLLVEFTVPPDPQHPEQAAAALRRVIRDWIESWDPKQPGRLTYTSKEFGSWWCTPRLFRAPPEREFRAQAYRLRQRYTWTIRNDDAFWRGTDSVSEFK